MERICIAMCTFEGEAYLDAQLASIASQSRLPDSLLIVDDASTDATLRIARAFAERAPFPVRVIRNAANLGFVRNFEKAISEADGGIIVLADQDDVWKTEKLAEIECAFAANPEAGAVFSDAELVDGELRPLNTRLSTAVDLRGELLRLARAGRMFEVLVRRNVVTGATLAFRSSYRDLVLPIGEGAEHDAWIALMISAVAPLVFIERPLILYRQHGRNQIGAQRLSFSGRVRRARESRVEGLASQRSRHVQALERLASVPILPETAGLLRQAAHHFDVRSRLPERRVERLLPILREVQRGGYRRMSRGLASACRDLLA